VTDQPGRDFFISYTAVNRSWAEWIAVQLEAAGYSTVLQAWDFRPGSDFLHQMQQATTTAGRTIAVLSPAYFGSAFGEAEWRAAFVKDPTGERPGRQPLRRPAPNGRVHLGELPAQAATGAACRLKMAAEGDAWMTPCW
jgi:hypothetical protein